MKLQDVLKEMPYLHPGEMPIDKKLDGSYSAATLKRDFKRVGTIGDAEVLMHNTHRFVIVITENQTAAGRYQPIFRVEFKANVEIAVDIGLSKAKMLQVNSVVVAKHEQGKQLASSVYKTLVDSGFVIVSDNTQFDPGAALWKKLAADSAYTTIVVDVDHGSYKDIAGTVIQYDGKNINDREIWSHGSDFDGVHRVLVLYKH
jgi:hypothetical protein